jgi:hypothetical protein
MDKNLIIKYDIEGEFHENYFYEISLDYNKSSNIVSLDNTLQEADDFLKEIDGKSIFMQYRGISRVDGKKIFVLNSSTIRREYKLNEIFK